MTEMKEVWVDIETVDDDFIAYKISNKGRICSNGGRICKYKGNHVNLLDRTGKYRTRSVSLLVAKAFGLKEPQCKWSCYLHHKDGDVDNNCVDNLYWDEYKSPYGAHIGHFKFTDEWYQHLHKVEKRYGSVIKAPNNDPDWQWVRNKAQGID